MNTLQTILIIIGVLLAVFSLIRTKSTIEVIYYSVWNGIFILALIAALSVVKIFSVFVILFALSVLLLFTSKHLLNRENKVEYGIAIGLSIIILIKMSFAYFNWAFANELTIILAVCIISSIILGVWQALYFKMWYILTIILGILLTS